jgi:hypothetical protein
MIIIERGSLVLMHINLAGVPGYLKHNGQFTKHNGQFTVRFNLHGIKGQLETLPGEPAEPRYSKSSLLKPLAKEEAKAP